MSLKVTENQENIVLREIELDLKPSHDEFSIRFGIRTAIKSLFSTLGKKEIKKMAKDAGIIKKEQIKLLKRFKSDGLTGTVELEYGKTTMDINDWLDMEIDNLKNK